MKMKGDRPDGLVRGRRLWRWKSPWVAPVGVVGVVIAVWELLAITVVAGGHILPTPVSVIAEIVQNWRLYPANIETTGWEALRGYFWGNVAGCAVAVTFFAVPTFEHLFRRLAVISYCLPVIAIGPIIEIIYNGDTPKVILSALSVFFTTLVGMLLGLRSADQDALDVVRVCGGSSWSALWKVQIPAAMPSLFAALKIAVPYALLGAIVGEYLGGDAGLGVAIIVAEQALDAPRTWALTLVTAALGGVAYVLVAQMARLAMPWVPRSGSR